MRRMTGTIVSVLLIVAVLVTGFSAPTCIERIMEENVSDVRIVDSEPVRFSASEDDSLGLIAMLNGNSENLSVLDVDNGYIYTKKEASEYAQDLISRFLLESGFEDPADYFDLSHYNIDTNGHYFLYTENDVPHNALIWSVQIYYEDIQSFTDIKFDEATGSLLSISIVLPADYIMNMMEYYEQVYALTETCVTEYAALSGLQLQDGLELEMLETSMDKYELFWYGFRFAVGDESGLREELIGYWKVQEDYIMLTIDPGNYPIKVGQQNMAKDEEVY